MRHGTRHPAGPLAAAGLALLLGLGACGDGGPAPQADGGADAAVDGSGGLEALCTQTGGTVGAQLCCSSATDFPNSCAMGTCGCSPTASHEVQFCTCPAGKCFSQDKGCRAP